MGLLDISIIVAYLLITVLIGLLLKKRAERSKKDYMLGDEMFLLVKIMDEIEPVHISGTVVWVSPPGALGNRPRGVGVQFGGDDARATTDLIESKLGASVSLTRSTHTM